MNQSMPQFAAETTGLYLVKKPVQRAQPLEGLREASTGRIVERHAPLRLEKVWAVAAADVPEAGPATEPKPPAELAFYRKYTEALLRRYLRLSMQMGRVPSMMSRDVFRGQVTKYSVRGFEETVIFCHDVEQRIARLNYTDQQLIKRVAVQCYSFGETAGMMGMSLNNLVKRYRQALDRLTEMLLEAGLLEVQRR